MLRALCPLATAAKSLLEALLGRAVLPESSPALVCQRQILRMDVLL